MSKFEKLCEMAKDGFVIDSCISIFDIKRLDSGCLSDIGDALIRKEEIQTFDGKNWISLYSGTFCGPENAYRVKQDKITVNGIEINAPYREVQADGVKYYIPYPISTVAHLVRVFGSDEERDYLVTSRLAAFKTEADVLAYADALGWSDE